MNKQDIKNTIVAYLKDKNAVRISLFGSFARKENHEFNDIDVLIKFRESCSLLQLISIENQLSEKLGIKVDLVTEGSLKNNTIKSSIQRDIRVIYEA